LSGINFFPDSGWNARGLQAETKFFGFLAQYVLLDTAELLKEAHCPPTPVRCCTGNHLPFPL
jgi:hypothetical protein